MRGCVGWIGLQSGDDVEAGLLESQRHPAGPRKEVDADRSGPYGPITQETDPRHAGILRGWPDAGNFRRRPAGEVAGLRIFWRPPLARGGSPLAPPQDPATQARHDASAG